MNWFTANNISVLPWPSQSADLNPIEHLWEITIKKKVYHTPVKNTTELKDVILKTWNDITADVTASLVDSMGRRCQAAISAVVDLLNIEVFYLDI